MAKNLHPIHVDLSPTQKKNLSKGKGVLVKPSQALKDGQPIFIGKVKFNKYNKNIEKNKGFKLTLSPEEVDANSKEGGSLFGVLKKVGKVGKEAYKALPKGIKKTIKENLKKLSTDAVDKGTDKVKKGLINLEKKVLKKYPKVEKEVEKFTEKQLDSLKKKTNNKIDSKMVEFENKVEGEGFKDFMKKAWRGTRKFVKEHKDEVKDIAKKGVKKAVHFGEDYFHVPEGARKWIDKGIDKGIDAGVDKLGGRVHYGRGKYYPVHRNKPFLLSENYTPLIPGNFNDSFLNKEIKPRPALNGHNDQQSKAFKQGMNIHCKKGSSIYLSGRSIFNAGQGLMSNEILFKQAPSPIGTGYHSSMI